MPNEVSTTPEVKPRRVSAAVPVAIVAAGVLLAGMLAMVLARGGGPKHVYSQATPDQVLQSAVEMIKHGETRRLSNLIYADSPEMRGVLNQLGTVLESMQQLSVSAAKRFPDEFKKLQDDALAAAEDPKNKSLVSQFMVGMTEFGNGKQPGRQPNADDIRNAFSAILADPFGWIDRNATRLTALKTSDDTASIMFDGQPAIPVVGLPMKLEGGKWYIQLPLNVPPISSAMPRTRQQWSIIGSVLKVTDNAMVDLRRDVDAGAVAGLKNLTDKFQDKVLFPVAIAFASYAKELDVRGRTDRRMSALRTRQRAWVDARKKAAPEGTTAVSPKLLEALSLVSASKVEAGVRANKPLAVDKMSDAEFEDLVGGWLASEGLKIRIDADLGPPVVDGAIAAWQEDRKSRTAAGKAPGKKP